MQDYERRALQLMFEAARQGDDEGAAMALEQWADPDGDEPGGDAPKARAVVIAAERGHEVVAIRLLNAGARADADALAAAAKGGCAKAVALMVRRGANPNPADGRPLRLAAASGSMPLVKLLLKLGADPSRREWAATAAARRSGHRKIATALSRADRRARPRNRATPALSPGALARQAEKPLPTGSSGVGVSPEGERRDSLYYMGVMRAKHNKVWRRAIRGDFSTVGEALRAAGMKGKRAVVSANPESIARQAKRLLNTRQLGRLRKLLEEAQ